MQSNDNMNASVFYMEFELNLSEIQKLNKMYFKSLYKEKVTVYLEIILFLAIFFDFLDLNSEIDFIKWLIRTLILIIIFFSFQYSFINTISKVIFQFTKRLLRYNKFCRKYRFNFTNFGIYVHSPLGEFVHQWSQIEKAILTKDFFLLYVKDKNGYIISISNKHSTGRKINELIDFINNNVIHITKI